MNRMSLRGLVVLVVASVGLFVESEAACTNKLDNCYTYPMMKCKPPNLRWAKENCELRCGLCNVVVDPPTTKKSKPVVPITGVVPVTGVIDTNICASEIDLTCDPNNLGGPKPQTRATTPERNSCSDRLTNCHQYPSTSCRDPYLGWARKNCQRRCGLCTYNPVVPAKAGCEDFGVRRQYGEQWYEKTIYGGSKLCTCYYNTKKIGCHDVTVTQDGCNDYGRMVSYGQQWTAVNSWDQKYTCTCLSSGKIDCVYKSTVTVTHNGCNNNGRTVSYGQRWTAINSSRDKYTCTCLSTGKIDCVFKSKGCSDTNDSCSSWAKAGECTTNPGYMLKGCPLSCGRC